ncbi:hypothetical protein QL285_080722 [Trifolium repens]|nr:hypothetical protein QL285_080722 [Trifolium repens]
MPAAMHSFTPPPARHLRRIPTAASTSTAFLNRVLETGRKRKPRNAALISPDPHRKAALNTTQTTLLRHTAALISNPQNDNFSSIVFFLSFSI